MSFQFLVIAGPDKDRVFTVQPGADLMLGRSAQAYYRVNDLRMSRSHCQVLLESEQVSVVCNGGSGGTLVNGKPVKRRSSNSATSSNSVTPSCAGHGRLPS